MTHFLQQDHICSNKATTLNSDTPHRPRIQTHESVGVIFFSNRHKPLLRLVTYLIIIVTDSGMTFSPQYMLYYYILYIMYNYILCKIYVYIYKTMRFKDRQSVAQDAKWKRKGRNPTACSRTCLFALLQ